MGFTFSDDPRRALFRSVMTRDRTRGHTVDRARRAASGSDVQLVVGGFLVAYAVLLRRLDRRRRGPVP